MAIKIKPLSYAPLRGGHALARALAGAWLFNEGRGDKLWDASGRGHTGTLTGMDPTTDWVAGPHGHALDFDGTDDRVIVGPEAGINLGTANACVVSYRHNTFGSDVLVAHKSQSDGGYFLGFSSGNVYYAASGAYVGVAHDISAGQEVWLAVSRQGTAVTFYKNGVQLGTVQTLSASNDLRISTIGSYWSGGSAYSTNMRCDYVYCWQRALSATEMAWLYREPFCFFTRSDVMLLVGPAGQVHNASGCAQAVSSASATAAAILVAWQPTGIPWSHVTLDIDASWRKEALLNGATDVAVKLGTVLTQGWFWTRRAGTAAVYRCEGPDLELRNSKLVAVAPLDARQITPPMYLPHEPSSSCSYLLRRFNGCGQQDRTTAAAGRARMGSDGQLAPPAPNTIFNLKVKQIPDRRVECTWFYWPLDQEAAPHVFNIYWNGGAGDVDCVNPIATLLYGGRGFYRYESGSLEGGRYIFAVGAESAAQVKGPSWTAAECEVKAISFGAPNVLDVEAI